VVVMVVVMVEDMVDMEWAVDMEWEAMVWAE
jgi:hypothetical protein